MLNTIKNPLVSVSELKKSPMSVIEMAKEQGDAVYILNNNKDVGVVIDSGRYADLVEETLSLSAENDYLAEKVLYLETRLRLINDQGTRSDEEVRGAAAEADLSDLPDEWD